MTEILIMGSGAMALYFGARLVSAGTNVTLVGSWTEGINALQKNGIRVSRERGEKRYPVTATSDINSINKTSLALVLVKSWQTYRAAQQLSEVLNPEGIALTLQNGLGNLDILRDVLGEDRSAQGVTTTGATLLEPGLVRKGGEGVINLESHPKLSTIKDILGNAGFKIEEVPDLSSIVWSKLVINAAINPVTALLGVPNGHLLKSPAAKEIMKAAANEAASVASAKGIDLNYQNPSAAVEEVALATAGNISSMLQDIRRGAQTEIEYINGAIIREAKNLGIPVPWNEILYKLVQSKVDLLDMKSYENS